MLCVLVVFGWIMRKRQEQLVVYNCDAGIQRKTLEFYSFDLLFVILLAKNLTNTCQLGYKMKCVPTVGTYNNIN